MASARESGGPKACIVDAASTGRLLVSELEARGVSCAHVASSDDYAGMPVEKHIPLNMRAYFTASGGFQELVAELRGWQPDFILPGCEHGVELCDRLNAALRLPCRNDADTTRLRRDKYEMHERLRQLGLPCAAQVKTSEADELSRWLARHEKYPVVVKPANSASSDGVRICADEQEALAAYKDLIGSVNFLGLVNKEIIAQEFLDGTQYYVNTVSWQGQHVITDIWRHDRRRRSKGAFLFENMVLQPSTGEVEKALSGYAVKVLDALGFRFGAAHIEIMWTGRGPVLVEANARLMGASIYTPAFVAALGYTQAQVLASACVSPAAFTARVGADYQIRKHLAQAKFIFTRSGTLLEFRRKEEIASLPSFNAFSGVPEIGSRVTETADTVGRAGFAYFLHEDRDTVLRDAALVLSWQRADSCFVIG
jgi:glutathione synthase/RimK-type ligase-like ATP-grasp enzyme